MIFRIAQQPLVFGFLHVERWVGFNQLEHVRTRIAARGEDSTGLNWQPSTKKSKKFGCASSRQCVTVLTSFSNSARFARDSNAMARAFDRGIAHLHNFRLVNVRNQADAFGGFHVQMPAKAAGQIKNVQLVEARFRSRGK